MIRAPLHSRVIALLLAGMASCLTAGAASADAIARCRAKGNDDTVRAMPPALARGAASALGVETSDIRGNPGRFVYRCMNGAVWACDHGANITCARADAEGETQGVAEFCKANPDGIVPMVVTGHGAAHSWTCENGRPKITGARQVDGRGFIADDWRRVDQ